MCQEIYHMMRTMNQDGLEFQLALQCAPLITGIKISNLLMVCGKREDAVEELLEGSDISCFCVMSSPKKTAFLLYREEELKQYLGRTDVRHLLKKLGYKDSSLDNVLPKFRKRYEAHMNGEQQFPHEMGLLLGYPIEDVVGFMEHSGKEYLYSGYWKVYENVSAKKQIFVRYDEARETLIRLLANDIGIRLICEIYKKDTTSHYVELVAMVS